jgi:hypothetical protein
LNSNRDPVRSTSDDEVSVHGTLELHRADSEEK